MARNSESALLRDAFFCYPDVSERTIRKLLNPVIKDLERIQKRNSYRVDVQS